MIFSHKYKWHDYFLLKCVSPIIKYLTLSDLIILMGLGLLTPIFAIYINKNISPSLEVVGLAEAIYLITSGIFKVPVASLIDKWRGDKDDFLALLIGSLIYSVIPLLYILVTSPLHLYVVQFMYGLAAAIVIPSWLSLFSKHIDKKHEAIEWSVYSTLIGFGTAFAATIGGYIAENFGFNVLFFCVSVMSFIGSLFILKIKKSIK